jgi:hypothetical protein
MIMLVSMFRALVFLSVLYSRFSQAVECPNGWTEMPPSRCALFVRATVNHQDALSQCRRLSPQSELLAVRSQADQDVAAMLCGARPTCWIDVVRDASDTWVHGDGSNAAFTNWSTGEPNGGIQESCATVVKEHGWRWNDIPCYTMHSVLCQIRIDETTTTAAQTTAEAMPLSSSTSTATTTATTTATSTTATRSAVPESTATVTSMPSAKTTTDAETNASSTTMTTSSWSTAESVSVAQTLKALTTVDTFTTDGASSSEPSGAAWVLPTAIVVALALALCGLAALFFFCAKKRSTRESSAAEAPQHGVELSGSANQYASLPLPQKEVVGGVAPLPAPHHYDSPTSKLEF